MPSIMSPYPLGMLSLKKVHCVAKGHDLYLTLVGYLIRRLLTLVEVSFIVQCKDRTAHQRVKFL